MAEIATTARVPDRRSVGAGTIYNLIGRIAFLFSGYALHFGLARILGPAGYGVVGLVLWLTNVARVLINDGARPAISKFTAENEGLAAAIRGAALRVQGLFAAAMLLAILAGAGLLARLLHDAGLAAYFRLASPLVPIMAILLVYQASLNGLQAFGRQATVTVVYSVARVILALLGGWLWKLPGAVLGLTSGPLVALLVARLLTPRGRSDRRFPIRSIIAFSIPTVAYAAAGTLLMCLDLLFVKALLGDSDQVGYYTATTTVAQIPYYALLPLVDTLLPVTSSLLAQGRREQARHTIATGLRYGLMLLVPTTVLLSATARSLAVFLYGRAYAEAGAPLTVLLWGQTFFAFFSVLTAVLIAEGKPGRAMALAAGMLPISALLNYLLVPRYGLIGAAWATTVATLAGFVASLALVGRDLGATLRWRSSFTIIAAGALCGALALWWRPEGLLLVPAYALLGGADILLLALFGELNRGDWQRLWSLSRLLRRSTV